MSSRTLARRVIAALLLVLLTACHSWRPTPVSPQLLIPGERPSSVRATLRSGERVTLENPIVRNDSIFGVTDAVVVGVAAEDVGLLEVRRLSIPRNIGLVFLITAAMVVAVAISCAISQESCEL